MSKDIVAGATLAAVAIPEVLGYTTMAQTPLATGLYTIIFPTMVVSLLDIIRRQYHRKSSVTGEMQEVVEGAPDPVKCVTLDAKGSTSDSRASTRSFRAPSTRMATASTSTHR